jgi:cytochrome c553
VSKVEEGARRTNSGKGTDREEGGLREVRMTRGVRLATSSLALVCALAVSASSERPGMPQVSRQPADRGAIEQFERSVRPVLVQHCYRCHGPNVQQGGVRLDRRAGLLGTNAAGRPLIVPGQPKESLLFHAVMQQGPIKMPPDGLLSKSALDAISAWIQAGAVYPEPPTAGNRPKPVHWAFRAPVRPALPKVRTPAWIRTPVDAFVLSRLENAGLKASPRADPRTLVRRVTYDLIGLPPTADEVDAFAADPSQAAYERLVDRLLASPRYGERWGRHWLDVARYADTKDGVLMYGDARVRPFAYTYRDYVIRAFNEDTPYDQFIREQLAGDQIQPAVQPWRLAAMGFLTLGRMFDNNPHDVIDDRIDTTSRGFLGITVSCARCHDHKFDPIPTADYYSLYGVFASSEAPLDLPRVEEPSSDPAAQQFEEGAAEQRKQIQAFRDREYRTQSETARKRVGDYLAWVATHPPDPLETAIFFLSLAPDDLRPQIVARWRRFLEKRAVESDPVFGLWHDLMQRPEAEFATASATALPAWMRRPPGESAGQANPRLREVLARTPIGTREALARAYGVALSNAADEVLAGRGADPAARQLADCVLGPDSPPFFPKTHTWHYMSRTEKDQFGKLLGDLDRLAVAAPKAAGRAMVLFDAEEIQEPRIFLRGNPATPGEAVPRRFLQVLSPAARRPFRHGSGRLDLAREIASSSNALTARVLVNRAWMHHFGEPLVATPSDFGVRCGLPTHPELLDWLATTFTRPAAPVDPFGCGWSLKRLHRLMVLSATYQQASTDRPDMHERDPENRLLWRAARRRLDFEQMRDGMLFVSGRLDTTTGGRPVDVAGDPTNSRRSVYGLVDRQSLPGVFRAFDFAVPDQSVERRPQTTVPQQALFGLNSPFVLQQARALASNQLAAGAGDMAARINALYRQVLARAPSTVESAAAARFLNSAVPARAAGGQPFNTWDQLAQVLLLTNEFLFLD